jgi:hypothetical protein
LRDHPSGIRFIVEFRRVGAELQQRSIQWEQLRDKGLQSLV